VPLALRGCLKTKGKPREGDQKIAGGAAEALLSGTARPGYRELLAVEWDDHAVEEKAQL